MVMRSVKLCVRKKKRERDNWNRIEMWIGWNHSIENYAEKQWATSDLAERRERETEKKEKEIWRERGVLPKVYIWRKERKADGKY